MTWRIVVVSSNAKIDFKMDYLHIRTVESTKRIHISEISVLMLESTAISITAYAVCEMLKNKIKIILCDHQRNPCGEIMSLNGGYDACEKIRQQMRWSERSKQSVWTEIVREKIRSQRKLLIKQKLPQESLLQKYMKEIELNDTTNREGHAAKVYFNALFGMGFSRADDSIVNAALNYGYNMILSTINREITAAGYLTQLGIFHDNTFNAFNLGCDLMEPIRPLVDAKVIGMNLEKIEHEEKMQILNLLNQEVQIEGRKHFLTNAIRIYCKDVFDALQSGRIENMHFIRYEL